MANYNQVGFGSSDTETVKTLQNMLNQNGANLTVDGKFGSQTLSALKNFQQNNGLAVDGIAGNNTWAALTKASTPAATTPATNSATATATPATTTPAKEWSYDPFKVSDDTTAADQKRKELESQKPGAFTYDDYEESDIVKQANALLQQHLANKPGEYVSSWQAQLDEILNKILNREKFSYDLNGDALYQQYKDQYMLQGQQAMMDTMGQAQAMTGGYGNSYAQSVGQQTYQGYLQQLNDRVPELYQLALDQYNREGDDLYNQYGLYADRESQDYRRYRDKVSDYYTELDRLTEDARYKAEDEYGKWMDKTNLDYDIYKGNVSDYYTDLGLANEEYWNLYNRDYDQYADDRNLSYTDYRNQVSDAQYAEKVAYQQERDKVDDEHWQKTFDEGIREYNTSLAEEQRQHNESIAAQQQTGDAIDFKSMGYDGYNDMIAGITDIYKSGGDEALARILEQYVAFGYLSEDDALSVSAYIGLEEEQKPGDGDNGICPVCGKATAACVCGWSRMGRSTAGVIAQ